MIEKISRYSAVVFATVAVFVFPLVVAGATGGSSTGLQNMVSQLGGLVQALIPIVIGLAVLVFLWGVLRYVIASDDAGKDSGRVFMLWGIIALFVMVSVWGLVNILRETLQLNPATPPAPGIPRPQGR